MPWYIFRCLRDTHFSRNAEALEKGEKYDYTVVFSLPSPMATKWKNGRSGTSRGNGVLELGRAGASEENVCRPLGTREYCVS